MKYLKDVKIRPLENSYKERFTELMLATVELLSFERVCASH